MNSKSFAILLSPDFEEAEKTVNKAVSKRETILIIGDCWVNYRGRASSKLAPGERILIIKEDGSLLVHRSVGYEAVNWQPPGCIFHIKAENDRLEIHAVRRKPTESVKIFFDKIHIVYTSSLVDRGEFALYATEEDMQKAILMEPSLVEEGFVPLRHEKKVEPGFVDVYGVDKEGDLVVVEIKRKIAGNDAVIQLAKYVDATRKRVNHRVRGILVAPDIAQGVQTLLATLKLEFKILDPKKCAKILKRPKTRKLESFFSSE